MGSDIGGIWADAAVEMLGAGEWLDLADRYTVTPDATAGAATSTPTTGENGVDGDPKHHPVDRGLLIMKGRARACSTPAGG
ncbi:hypothetical protein GS447_08290 [Rhodococcus hoagii]|nr:hypothetical protein [Prescottella equi]